MADSDSTGWEERLDIDDSDLFAIVPPTSSWPLRPCSSRFTNPSVENPRSVSPRLIPGPAGAVQAAMHRIKRRHVGEKESRREDNGRVGVSMDFDGSVDGDFQLDSWICAMQYLGRESNSVSPIGSIDTRTIGRIPMVVGLVKSCTPNGLGDLILTLKDQTGMVGASIHHKALSEGTLGSDVTVGCVLILKQVVIFCPARSIKYLNITEDNVVKLIGKNCGPPQEQLTSSAARKFKDNGKRAENKQLDQPVVNNGLENHAQIGASAIKETRCERVDSCGIISRLNPKANEASTTHIFNIPHHHQTRTVELAGDSQDILRKISGDAMFHKISKASTSIKIAKENLKSNRENVEKEKPVSKISIPEWTDEQLSELFADY